MKTSLFNFQDHLIDYAGVFPPANLPLEIAIGNYASYKNSSNSWMLGPFVLPVSQLMQLDSYIHLFSPDNPLALSIIGRKCSTETECLTQFMEDVQQIHAFINQYSNIVKVEVLEIPLPAVMPSQDLLLKIANEAANLKVRIFCEVGFISDGEKHATETLNVIALHNSLNDTKMGVKLRTGGIHASMFPRPDQIAFLLASCRDRDIPLKFTAGLHHPVRMYRDEVNTKMYGFLNVFLAGMLANKENLSLHQIEEILTEENPNHFSFSNDYISWKNLGITSQEIKVLRQTSLQSFGCCSFDEPKDELRELVNQQGVIL